MTTFEIGTHDEQGPQLINHDGTEMIDGNFSMFQNHAETIGGFHIPSTSKKVHESPNPDDSDRDDRSAISDSYDIFEDYANFVHHHHNDNIHNNNNNDNGNGIS